MTIQFYDTRLRTKVPLETRDRNMVNMYACGPTPYDVPHVGHARTAITYDVIRRYLQWRGYEVVYASNVTDIEDKIIARAQQEGSTEPEIVARYENVFHEQFAQLNIRPPDHVPRATEYIAKMQELIGKLVELGIAYVVPDSGVYFSVEKYANYGQLSHRKLEDLQESAGARVEVDEQKRSPMDFALWKAAKPAEPSWDSPWGVGRPGWHIECSAMSLDLLGENFDIHGGGADLVFPHHENEIAQAEGAGARFARHWIHSALLNISGEKMSKSLGNFVTLGDALAAHGGRALRLFMLQTHYRMPMDLSEEGLAAAASAGERLDALERAALTNGLTDTDERDSEVVDQFTKVMDDDFNTPGGLGVVFEAVRKANKAIVDGDTATATVLVATVRELTGVLGIITEAGIESDEVIDSLIEARNEARANKNFAEADRIRDELASRGIVLEDSSGGTIWRRGN